MLAQIILDSHYRSRLNRHMEMSLEGKSCDPVKVTIGRRLADLVNSVDGLWRKLAALNRDLDFMLIESNGQRIVKQLDIIEQEIGRDERIEEIRSLFASSY